MAGHDYAASGWYFVTICANERACLFGAVRNGIVGLSTVGGVAHRRWAAIPDHFDRVRLGAFVVMPNHVHGLVGLLPCDNDGNTPNGGDIPVATRHDASLQRRREHRGASLGVIVGQYKGAVTRWARRNGHHAFGWQPRFYDHVVRSEQDLRRIRQHIHENPLRWNEDKNHPAHW